MNQLILTALSVLLVVFFVLDYDDLLYNYKRNLKV